MNREYEKVRDFHIRFGAPYADSPRLLERDRVEKRSDWMREEIDELGEAKDVYDQADAMIDLIYFALGTLVEMGVQPDQLFDIVHEANMAKLFEDGAGRANQSTKIIKPPNWEDPKPKLIRAVDSMKRQSEDQSDQSI
jgi:predicted HAD superfamily Cof-like phosphohydrolase